MTGYDSLTFTRQTAERIAADLNKDACGLTASWDGDLLIFNATEAYNGDAFTEAVVPDEHGHYTIDASWPWSVWSEDLDPDEHRRAFARGARTSHEPTDPLYSGTVRTAWQQGRHEAEQLLKPALRGQCRPHRHLITPERKPLEAPSAPCVPSPARRQR
ncbi:hypothetical protein ACWDO7_27460 [Streptomyces sp. NPDC003656]